MTDKEQLVNLKAQLIIAIQNNILHSKINGESEMVEVHKKMLKKTLKENNNEINKGE